MPKGRKTIVSISQGFLPGQRKIAGNVIHMTVKCHHRDSKFYPGRVSESETVDGKRGNSYGNIVEKMLLKKSDK
jgi:hypothetical protein